MAYLAEKRCRPGDDFPNRIRHLPPPEPLRGDVPQGCVGTHDDLVKELLAPWEEDILEDDDANRSKVKGYVSRLVEIIEGHKQPGPTIAGQAEDLFRRFDAYRVLAVHRAGPLGVAGLRIGLEKKIRAALEQAWSERAKAAQAAKADETRKATKTSPLPTRAGKWLGQAILITQNDPDLGVYNGDVGLVLPDPDRGHRLALALPKVADPDDDEPKTKLRYLSLERLPEHEGAFVMTVHKAQGSQFEHTAVVLSTKASPIQTRELVYTGITRAKQKVTWVGTRDSLEAALATRVLRGSFLEARITGRRPPRPEMLVARGEGVRLLHAVAPLHPFIFRHFPVDGSLISRRALNKAADETRGMSRQKLDALLAGEPRVVSEGRSWRLVSRAPMAPGCPLDRATRAVLKADHALLVREVKERAELSDAEWEAIRVPLYQQPAVEYVGVGKGARYMSQALFERLWVELEAELESERRAKPQARTIKAEFERRYWRLNER